MSKAANKFEQWWDKLPKVPLSYMGFGLTWVFSELMFVNAPGAAPTQGLLFNIYDAASIAIAALIVALTSRPTWTRRLASIPFILPATFGFMACSIFLRIIQTYWFPAMGFLGIGSAVSAGAGSALAYALWGEFLGCLDPVKVATTYALDLMVRVAIIWTATPLPPLQFWTVVTLSAGGGMLGLWRSYANLDREEVPRSPQGRISIPWKPLSVLMLCAASLALVYAFAGNTLGVNGNPGGFIAALIIFFILAIKRYDFSFPLLWKLALGAMAVSFVPFGIVSPQFEQVSAVCASASYALCLMLTAAILANLSYRYSVSGAWLFSIEFICRLVAAHAGSFIGTTLSQFFAAPYPTSLLVGGTFALFLLAIAMVIAMQEKSLDSSWGVILKHPLSEDLSLLFEKTRLGVRCREVATGTHLTKREEEILLLLLHRHSPKQIAEILVIEPSTVRVHVKHIYAKTGVHSKQQLISFVENGEKYIFDDAS